MTKHVYFPYTSTYSSTIQTETQYSLHPLHKHTTYPNTPKAKKHYPQQCPLHNKHSHRHHTVTTTDIKISMRHIHTSIVSRHLATRGNNKLLCTPPPHISSSEELYPSPLFPLCNTHIHNTHHLFNCTLIRTTLSPLDLWTVPAGVIALLARETGWWTTSGKIRLTPH